MRIVKPQTKFEKFLSKLAHIKWKIWCWFARPELVYKFKLPMKVDKGNGMIDAGEVVPKPYPDLNLSSLYKASYDVAEKDKAEEVAARIRGRAFEMNAIAERLTDPRKGGR